MSRKSPHLEVDVLLEPRVSAVTEADVEIAVLLRLRQEVPPDAPALPLHLVIAPLGPGAINAPPVLRGLDGLRPGDRVSLPGGRTHLLSAGESPEAALDALVKDAFMRPEDTAAAALTQAREILSQERRQDVVHRLLMVAHSPVSEPMEPLLAAATALTEKQPGLDVVTTSPSMDLGMMVRLANLGGGEVNSVDSAAALETAIRQRVFRLTRQHVIDARLELDFVPGVSPGRMYRVTPMPVFLGNVRLTPTDRRLVLDPGPLAPGHEPSFLMTLTVPRRRLGHYRLVEIISRHRVGHRHISSHQLSVVHHVTDDPTELGYVEANVVAARDRVEPAGWVEEAARAFLEGDHRRVATTLERIARRFLEMGRPQDAQATVDVRSRYLRAGHLDRTELNKLRRLAGQALA